MKGDIGYVSESIIENIPNIKRLSAIGKTNTTDTEFLNIKGKGKLLYAIVVADGYCLAEMSLTIDGKKWTFVAGVHGNATNSDAGVFSLSEVLMMDYPGNPGGFYLKDGYKHKGGNGTSGCRITTGSMAKFITLSKDEVSASSNFSEGTYIISPRWISFNEGISISGRRKSLTGSSENPPFDIYVDYVLEE